MGNSVHPIPCRCKNDGIGNPKLKVALTYEPQTDDLQSTAATDDNDNTLATVKGVDQGRIA